MARVITFANHSPIRIREDGVETVYDANPQWGYHVLKRYTTTRGKDLYWAVYCSGISRGVYASREERYYLRSVAEIRERFPREYSQCIEWHVDPDSILDVDSLSTAK